MERANFYASHGNYQRADDDYNEALKKCPKDKKDQVHYAYSKIMYTYTHYPIDQATEQALTAYELNPLPLYLQQIADCYFAGKNTMMQPKHTKNYVIRHLRQVIAIFRQHAVC